MGSAENSVRDGASHPAPTGPVDPDDPGQVLTPEIQDAIDEIAGVIGAWCPSLSPDGTKIAYVTDRSGLPRLEVAPLNPTPGEYPSMVSPAHQEVVSAAWSPDGQWLAYLVSPGGLIRAELHVMRPDGSESRALAGTDSWATVFAGCWTSLPHTYAFSLADGHGPDADVCLVDVVTGEVRSVATGGMLTVTSVSGDGRQLIARRGTRGRRHLVIADIPAAGEPPSTEQAGTVRRLLAVDFPAVGTDLAEDGRFAANGSGVYLRTAAGRERSALGLVEIDAEGDPGSCRILAERADADLESYAILAGDTALLVWNLDGVSVVEVRDLLDGRSCRIDIGDRVMPGWSVHRDGRSAVFELTEPLAPRSIYHVDLAGPLAGRAALPPERLVGLPDAHLPHHRLAVPELRRYPAADGLGLQGLLYRPPGIQTALPTVVLLHGGPESQERPAFSILIQSLVAAGFAVFAPNVRGSTGYGSTFVGLDDLGRRESSFQDVPATVDYLVESGVSAPGRIGVHGWSYGGYLALVALTRWPTLFASGSSHAGMSDLATFFTETETWMAAASVTEYGDPVADADLLQDLSPLHRMDRVRAPTLLVHGEQDTNVPVGESVRAYQALRGTGVPTEMFLLPGEGHTIVGRDGRVASTRLITEWHKRWTS